MVCLFIQLVKIPLKPISFFCFLIECCQTRIILHENTFKLRGEKVKMFGFSLLFSKRRLILFTIVHGQVKVDIFTLIDFILYSFIYPIFMLQGFASSFIIWIFSLNLFLPLQVIQFSNPLKLIVYSKRIYNFSLSVYNLSYLFIH